MDSLIFFAIIALIGFIWWRVYTSYEKKVQDVITFYNSKLGKFSELQNLKFEVRTDGKKIVNWDKQHTIDFIIIKNKSEIIRTLRLYNEYTQWWISNKEHIKEATKNYAIRISSNMFLFGKKFINRTTSELERLLEKCKLESIKYELKTYTLHNSGRRYNPRTHQWWTVDPKEVTSWKEISPDDVLYRVEILARYNFQMTEYEYNIEDQRKLMTPELKRKIIERDNGICQLCGKKCHPSEIEIDHIKPVSKGGKSIESNLQVLCMSCNRKKSNKYLEEIDLTSFIKPELELKHSKEENGKAWEEFENKYNKKKYNKLTNNGIKLGDIVTIQFKSDGFIERSKLVSEDDSELGNKLSVSSPIGEAVLGLEENDEIDVKTPNGIETIRIIKIEKSQ